MGEAIGYYNSITTHRYHKETIRHSFTAHYIISLRCTIFEFYNTEVDRDSSNSGHVFITGRAIASPFRSWNSRKSQAKRATGQARAS